MTCSSLDAWRHADPQDSVGQMGDAEGIMLHQPVEKRGALVFCPGVAVAADGLAIPSPPATVTVLCLCPVGHGAIPPLSFSVTRKYLKRH